MYSLKTYLKSVGYLNVCLLLLYLIDPFSYGYVFGAVLIVNSLLKKNLFTKLDGNFLLLLLFSVCYAIFYMFDLNLGSQYVLIYTLFPCSFYLIGKSFHPKGTQSYPLFKFMFLVGLSFSLPSIISILLVINEKGFVTLERDVSLIWNDTIIPATNMAAFFVLNMSIPAFLIAYFKKFNLFYKLLLTITFIISVVCLLRLGSRTQLSIFFITFLVTLVYLIRKQTLKQNLMLFGTLFVLFNVFLSYVSFGKNSDIMSAFTGRMDSKKYGAATAGGRTERWSKSIINLWEEPLGWQLTEFGYSHNMWFDVARVGGTLSFILLLIFTVVNVITIKNAIQTDHKNILLNTIFICYNLSFYLLFFVEPVFDGYFPVFILYCFFLGIISQYIQDGKSNEVIKNQ